MVDILVLLNFTDLIRLNIHVWSDFMLLIEINFITKVDQIFDNFLAIYFGKHHFLSYTALATVWQSLEKNWAIFSNIRSHVLRDDSTLL